MEKVGVLLAADGSAEYFATLAQVNTAARALVSATQPAVAAINALDDKSRTAAASAVALGRAETTAAADATKLAGGADNAAEEAAGLGAKATAAAGDVDRLGDQAKGAGKEAAGLGDKAKKGGDGLSFLDRAAKGAAERVGELATEGLARAAQAALDFAVNGVRAAGDFEQGMSRFASVTGDSLEASGQSLGDFKELFLSLGRDLPVSTAEVQQAAIEMAKGGIEPATIAAGGLRTALDLAAAAEVGIAESAEILAKQLGVWVDKAADATTKSEFLSLAANLLSQAANASTVNVDDLALGLANAGKSADIAGLSFQETVTSMAVISSGFSSAADAGTSFKTFLQRLTPATDTQAEAFKRLNLLTSEGNSVFYDATGSFIGMEQAAAILQDRVGGLSEAERKMALEAAFGSDAIRTAGMLADAGAEGYRAMAEEMLRVGSVAEQAARKQQGFNVAVDNVMGSLEALQITVFSAVLPVFTSLAGVLAGGINAITNYAKATIEGKTALAAVASFIGDVAVPAITGLGAALTAYAFVQLTRATPAILASLPAIAAQTGAFVANAAAVMAAAAPYALLALAVGGMVLAYQNFQNKVKSATQQLLESRAWWNESTAVIERHGLATGAAAEKLKPYAATISAIRTQIEGEIADLARRDAAGMVSDEQRTAEMALINQHTTALQQATAAYNSEEAAILAAQTASMTATAEADRLRQGTFDLGSQASLTAEDVAKLGEQIQATYQKGQEAVQAYATTQSEFLTGIETRQQEHAARIQELETEKQNATTEEQRIGIDARITAENESYRTQEQNAAAAYAAQQAAQQAHLGQMLIDYTVAQASLGNISKEKAAEITAALETEYGLQESSVATAFLNMAGSIDRFASDSSGSIDGLIGSLRDQADQAADTQKAMDDYAKEYTATQTNNFLDGKQDADTYISSLERIPRYVETRINRHYTRTGDLGDGPDNNRGQYAEGGRFPGGEPMLVGERGPELLFPRYPGMVVSNTDVRTALASPAQMHSASYTFAPMVNITAPGANVSEAQIKGWIHEALYEADRAVGRDVDARLRTWVQ